MKVFSIDLFPENGYLKNDPIRQTCVARNKELFGDSYTIYTKDSPIIKEAIEFLSKEIGFDILSKSNIGNTPKITDLIRVYILSKNDNLLYLDCDIDIFWISEEFEKKAKPFVDYQRITYGIMYSGFNGCHRGFFEKILKVMIFCTKNHCKFYFDSEYIEKYFFSFFKESTRFNKELIHMQHIATRTYKSKYKFIKNKKEIDKKHYCFLEYDENIEDVAKYLNFIILNHFDVERVKKFLTDSGYSINELKS